MAKQYKTTAANTQPVATQTEPEQFSPAWINKNKDKLMQVAQKDLGIKLITQEELTQQTAIEQAAKDLGIDFNKIEKTSQNNDVVDVTDFVNKVAAQIDMLYTSTQWKDILSRKNKCALHAVRTFIRQMRNESAPPGQAKTLADLIGCGPSVPRGALGAVGGPAKRIRVTDAHLQAAGILPNGVNLGTGAGPTPMDLDV